MGTRRVKTVKPGDPLLLAAKLTREGCLGFIG
jgi:hypothetical protein